MKLEGPEGNPIAMADIFEANGGQGTLPKALTATFWGLTLGGLTALGTKGLALGAAGKTLSAGSRAASTAVAAAAGVMGGAEMNSRRLLTDLGIRGDPRTGEAGEWTMDFLLNNFFGTSKSFKASPGQGEFNLILRQGRFEEQRTVLNKSFYDAARNGSESEMLGAASAIRQTFLYQWAETETADAKFNEWMTRTFRTLQKNPAYASVPEDYLMVRLAALRETQVAKTEAHRKQIREVMAQVYQKRAGKTRNTKLVDVE